MTRITVEIRTSGDRIDLWMHLLQALRSLLPEVYGDLFKITVSEDK